jgi:outer membrane protein assembly factor BamB
MIIMCICLLVGTLPITNAQTMTKKTYAMISVTPNPVQVNQQVAILAGITDYLAQASDGWEGITVTIEEPDNSITTLGPLRTDASGGRATSYTPTAVGTYYVQTHFPAQWFNWSSSPWYAPWISGPVYYEASDSDIIELVVQEDPILTYPGHSLPDEYWTRPIDAQLREWSAIAGSWLVPSPTGGLYAPNNEYAPESAHIIWTKELAIGGLVGGEYDSYSYFCGDSYYPNFGQSVIISGILYYNRFQRTTASRGSMEAQGFYAVDLHTGEELWFKNNSRLAFGQVLYYSGYNMHGAFAYVWETVGSTWYAYDALTGEWVYTLTNVPSGKEVRGPNGEILRYVVNTRNGWMALWNSTQAVTSVTEVAVGDGGGSWAPYGFTFDASVEDAYTWNVTIPTGLLGSVQNVLDDRVIGASITQDAVYSWGLSVEPENKGTLLFNNTWNIPSGNLTLTWGVASLEDGVFTVIAKEARTHYGFSLDTGKLLWGPTDPQPQLDFYLYGYNNLIAYGKLYSASMAGVLHCYNVTTGKFLWKYEAKDTYSEISWSNNWPIFIPFITDGKIYLYHAVHLPPNPKPRGAPFICLDAESGDEIWRVDGLFRGTKRDGTAIIGDSIIVTQDTYDQRIYAIGKGPSSITVDVRNDITLGRSVTIFGTVLDVSPGTEDEAIQLRFPNGVPAISDEDMSEWMLYVYKQFERPEDATGVEVFVKIQDPNGDWYSTYVTADSNGVFSFMWAPAIVGEYHVTAMFEGSASYYASQATTFFGVDAVQVTEDVPSAEEIAQTTVNKLPAYPAIPEIPAYLTIDIILLVIAAVGVVIGLVAYMALRKQK